MNYTELFYRVLAVLSTPARAWDKIAEKGKGNLVLAEYVYPLIGLCGLCEFIGAFIGKDISSLMFQVALTRCCAVAVSLFGGYFLSVSLLSRFTRYWYGWQDSTDRMQLFVAYSMTVTFVLDMISGLVSIVVLGWVLQLYTIVIVYEGARRLVGIKESRLVSYTMWATLAILACPVLIEIIFNKLSVILN